MIHQTHNAGRQSNWVSSLDFLRTCAILLVFVYHYQFFAAQEWLSPFGRFGWIGVDLFFVLSGFLIGSQLFKSIAKGERPSFRSFYLRRSLRILPCYLTILAIYFLFPAIKGSNGISPLWKFLTFTENFGLNWKTAGAYSQTWSLCVEEHFYLILPVSIYLIRQYKLKVKPKVKLEKRTIYLLMLIPIIGAALRAILWWKHILPLELIDDEQTLSVLFFEKIYYPTYNRMDGILIGLLIAMVYRFYPSVWTKLIAFGNQMTLLGFMLLLYACWICSNQFSLAATVFGYPLLSLGFGCLVIGGHSRSSILSKIKIPGTQRMAVLAYTLYLVHLDLIEIFQKYFISFGIEKNGVTLFILTLGACISVSVMVHLAIERPFLNLRDFLFRETPVKVLFGKHIHQFGFGYLRLFFPSKSAQSEMSGHTVLSAQIQK